MRTMPLSILRILRAMAPGLLLALSTAALAGSAAASPFGVYGTRCPSWILEHPSRIGFWIYQLPYTPNESDYTLVSAAGRDRVGVIAVQNLYRSNDERFMRTEEVEPRAVGEAVARIGCVIPAPVDPERFDPGVPHAGDPATPSWSSRGATGS